nr:MAG TPA: hypothetical protein [Caudoviricetes sp.]
MLELLELRFLVWSNCKKSLKKNIDVTTSSIEYYV